ncbi:MAG: hypothetical protein ACRC0R_02460 [Cetobacterium sp.]
MAWKCKECGGNLLVIVTVSYSNTHKIDKDGDPSRRTGHKDTSGEHIGNNIFCEDCNVYCDTDENVENVGVWKK